jgi:hypothetical protein
MKWMHALPLLGAAVLLAGCATMGGGDTLQVRMTGAEEVPPVTTSASGSGTVTVDADGSVSGSFKVQSAAPFLAAHIHMGAAGKNGPVIIPLRKTSDTEWVIPAGAKLTDAQYQSYKAGELYVNFHSAKFKGGEIRGQLRPSGTTSRSGGYSY